MFHSTKRYHAAYHGYEMWETAKVMLGDGLMESMRMPRNATDILVKHLSGAFPSGVLDVIGLHGVEVVRALPTELDTIEIRQDFTDFVWELRDGTILHLESQTNKEYTLYRFCATTAPWRSGSIARCAPLSSMTPMCLWRKKRSISDVQSTGWRISTWDS